MPRASFLQTSFLGGEWSLFSQGRADLPEYKTALNVCFNSFPLEEGCWTRRPGTQWAGYTFGGKPGRVIPFQLTGTTPLTMEFTDGVIRFRNGAQLMYDTPVPVVAITPTTPAQLGVGTSQPWITGDEVIFLPTGNLSTIFYSYVVGRTFLVTRVNGLNFNLQDSISGQPVDGTKIGFNNNPMTVARVKRLSIDGYRNSQWANVRSVQTEFQSILLHRAVPPQALVATPSTPNLPLNQFVMGNSALNFSVSAPQFLDGPYFDPVPQAQAVITAQGSGVITVQLGGTLPNGGQGFLQTDINRLMRFHSEPPTWDPTITNYRVGQSVKYNGQYYTSLINATAPAQPNIYPTVWAVDPSAHNWLWGVIIAVFDNSHAQLSLGGPAARSPGVVINTYQMGLYSVTTGFPTCGAYHEGRLWLGGVVPNRFDASTPNGQIQGNSPIGANFTATPFNFSPSDALGNVTDANAIAYTLNDSESNNIVWMMPNLQGIVMGTQGGEWLIQATNNNNVLTPTSIQGHKVTKYGCANVEPRRTGLTTVFVQKLYRRALEYLSDVFSGKFFGPNLNEKSRHLTVSGLLELAYHEEPTPIIWARTGNGAFVGSTYRRVSLFSSEPPKFNAWHEHALGSLRTVESICAGADPVLGLSEALTMVTNDPATNIRHVEILTQPPNPSSLPLTLSWYVDSGIVPAFGIHDATNTGLILGNFPHLEGKTVTVWLCGLDLGDYTVQNGQIHIFYGVLNGTQFDQTVIAQFNNATAWQQFSIPIDQGTFTIPGVIGFTYVSEGQLLRQLDPAQAGAANGPALGKTRRLHMAAMLLNGVASGALNVGTDPNNPNLMRPIYLTNNDGSAIDQTQQFTGVWHDVIESESDFEAQIAWTVKRPYPCVVMAVEGFLMTQDR